MASTDTQRRFVSPPLDMVQTVRNIVNGYSMGSVRALAQDGVQNSYDARRAADQTVSVEYELLEREGPNGLVEIMTVTDSGTTGLRGPALSSDDLHRRERFELMPDENWAAFEAMGYTKVGEDNLGSRGQGKAAFLFHSRHAAADNGGERMVMLYDTLLEDGTYRLGARVARPDDAIMTPPYEDDDARRIVTSTWDELGVTVPLGLEPLTEVGTRIIVPFVSEEVRDAFATGELLAWLERCWWRAIQVGDLDLAVTVGGVRQTVTVPAWWADEPWERRPRPTNILVRENVPLEPGSPLKIKRIVLSHDPTLSADEVSGYSLQFSGVQLLRGKQWIETLSAAEKFGDFIPPSERAGFRGFVEFDRFLDRELRSEKVERPQHDGFIRRRLFVTQIDAHVREAVVEFAREQGWVTDESSDVRDDRTADEVLQRVSELFVAEGSKGERGREEHWQCTIDVDYPRAATTRVDYNEELRRLAVECQHEPALERKDVELTLEVVRPDGTSVEIARRSGKTLNGKTGAEFGDFKVVHTGRHEREIACADAGAYRLRARCFFDGQRVATATRRFFVACDPPEPEGREFAAALLVENVTADRVRINHGDAISMRAIVKNKSGSDAELRVNLSVGDILLADEHELVVAGRPRGDEPGIGELYYPRVRVFTSTPDTDLAVPHVVLEPGQQRVRFDVFRDGEVVAHSSRLIYVEVDPKDGGAELPFDVRAREDLPYPIWELQPPAAEGGRWILLYAPRHPSFETTSGLGREAVAAFWAETFCSALVEWSLRIYRDSGDEGAFLLMTTGTDGNALWERYESTIQRLLQLYEDPIQCLTVQREVVSLMLCLLDRN